jgi:HEAT repeat protein
VLKEAESLLAGIDKNADDYEHLQLETLWLHQAHDVVNLELLKAVLNSPEPRARAAATRVLCYWRDRVPEPIALLTERVNDEHPRVRLEAVRALSFFHEQPALDAAVECLIYDTDDYLKYALDETIKTLERRIAGATSVPDNPTEREKRTAAAEKRRGQPESIAPVVPRSENDRAK